MRRTPATWTLIGINVAVFLITGVRSGFQFDLEHMVRFGADNGVLTLSGQWWRLVTSMFLHFNFLHIVSNMACLFFLGRLAEREVGSGVFLGSYLLAGTAGSVASVMMNPTVVSAGASGAVFGTAGLLLPVLLNRLRRKSPTAPKELWYVIRFSGYNLVYSFVPGVDATAHFGGFIAGILLGFALWDSPAWALSPRRLRLTFTGATLIVGVGAAEAHTSNRVPPGGYVSVIGDSLFVMPAPYLATSIAPDIRALEKRLATVPDSASVYVALATAYGSVGRSQEAVAVLLRGVHRMPKNVELLTALGSAELNTGNLDHAIVEFDAALALSPGSADSRYNLATALLDRAQSESGRRGAEDSMKADVRRILSLPAATSEEMKSLQTTARALLPKRK